MELGNVDSDEESQWEDIRVDVNQNAVPAEINGVDGAEGSEGSETSARFQAGSIQILATAFSSGTKRAYHKQHTPLAEGVMMERNSSLPKDFERLIPKPFVLSAKINGKEVRALLDSGSVGDFISTTLADQLKLPLQHLLVPLPCQLAATGSRTMITSFTIVDFDFQDISERRRFEIMNIESYDLILGTPFLFQHRVSVGFNPTKLAIGANISETMMGPEVASIASMTATIVESGLDDLGRMLREEATDLCKSAEETPLPPFVR